MVSDEKIHNQASMLGIPTKDSEKLVKLIRAKKIPRRGWFKNYSRATPVQREVIMALVHEQAALSE